MKIPEMSGPATAKTRRPWRSARYPKSGCGSADAIENVTARVAAIAIDSPMSVMMRGNSGGMNEAYASVKPCASATMIAIRVAETARARPSTLDATTFTMGSDSANRVRTATGRAPMITEGTGHHQLPLARSWRPPQRAPMHASPTLDST